MITCKICGLEFKALPRHLKDKHGIDKIKYLEIFPGADIVCEEYRKNLSESVKRTYNSSCKEDIIDKIKKTKLERYGDENYNNQAKTKETLKLNYGVDNVYQLNNVKDKIKKTKLERYGDEKYTNQAKTKETLLNRYGIDNAFKLNSVKETMENRYGVVHPFQSKEILEKCKASKIKNYIDRSEGYHVSLDIIHYDFKNANNCKEMLEKFYIQNNRKPKFKELAKIYNTTPHTILTYINKYNLRDYIDFVTSNLENIFEDYIKSLRITYIKHDKTILKPLEIDFYFPEYGIGVEINDIASHNSTLEFRGVPPKTKEYHQTKILLAQSCNTHLIHLYEWEVTDEEYMIKFINYLKLLFNIDIKHIGARQCVIKEINDEANFLNEYHLQSYTKSKIKLGLYYKDDLVEVMTFGKPRFNGEFEYELIRLCTKFGYGILGGANKLFNYFINMYSPQSILSYCDLDKFSGEVYTKLKFKHTKNTAPNYYWTNYTNTFSRYTCQRLKLSKLFNKIYDSHLTENDIMINEGYLKVFTSGNSVWEWHAELDKIMKGGTI